MITKAKLFGKISVELVENTVDKRELVLLKPIQIKPKDFIGNLKIKLPESLNKLLDKQLEIKYLSWKKPKETTIKLPIKSLKLFAKVEKYMQLEEVSIIVKTKQHILK